LVRVRDRVRVRARVRARADRLVSLPVLDLQPLLLLLGVEDAARAREPAARARE
jgi:hypothetical protein